MSGNLEIRRWARIGCPAFAVAQSQDGQYIAVGSEQGVHIFDSTGANLLTFPPTDTPLPVHQLAAAPDLAQIYVGARQGQLVRLDLERTKEGFDCDARPLLREPDDNDLHTLALSANVIAVGHLAPALTLLQTDGELLWRRHPRDGTATEGRLWSVALDEKARTLYLGSAGTGTNRLAALDINSRAPRGHCSVEARITALVPLAAGRGVAAVLAQDVYSSRLVAFDNRMEAPLWEHTFDGPVTALATDAQAPLLVAGVGYEGQATLIDTDSGHIVASQTLKSVVNGLALTQGRFVAAATQDGNLALLRHLPEEFRL